MTEQLNNNKVGDDKRKALLETSNVKVLIAQLCPTLCDSMDCSPPDSSFREILQARILWWVVIPFSRGYFQTQGLNPGPLHWQEDSSSLSHQGSLLCGMPFILLPISYIPSSFCLSKNDCHKINSLWGCS